KAGRGGGKSGAKAENKAETGALAPRNADSLTPTENQRGRLGRRGAADRSTDKPEIPVPQRSQPAATADATDSNAAAKPGTDARAGTESRRPRIGRRSRQPNAEKTGEGTPAASADSPDAPADNTETKGRRGGLLGGRRRSRSEKQDAAPGNAATADKVPQTRAKSDGGTTPGAATPNLPARSPRGSRATDTGAAPDTPALGQDRASTEQNDSASRRRRFGRTPAAAATGDDAAASASNPDAGSSPASSPADRPAQRRDRPRRPLSDPLDTPGSGDDDSKTSSSTRDAARGTSTERQGPDMGDVVKAAGAAGAIGAAAGSLASRERRAPIGSRERDAAPDTTSRAAGNQAADAPARADSSAPATPRTASDRAAGVSSRLDKMRKMREQRRSTPLATPAPEAENDNAASPAERGTEAAATPGAATASTADAAPTRRASTAGPGSHSRPRPVRDISDTDATPSDASPAAAQNDAEQAAAQAQPATDDAPTQDGRPEWLQRRQSQRTARQAQTEAAAADAAPSAGTAAPERSAPPASTASRATPAAQRTQRPAPPEPKPDPGATVKAPEQTPTQAAEPVAAPPVRRRSVAGRGPSAVPAAQTAQPAAARAQSPATQPKEFRLPDFRRLLRQGDEQRINDEILLDKARVIEDTLASFNAPGKVVEVNPGPVITQFGIEPDYLIGRGGKKMRVKVGSIAKLDADLALALAARTIRIEAPVPGKGFVGIEVPNDEVALVGLYDIMESPEFSRLNTYLKLALGLGVDGSPVAADLTAMPHLLIAGTTGSGKSVCVNSIITALLLNNTPDQVQFIMVDPKRVELTGYNGIPHLVAPVVVELERIVGVLQWVQREMEERYRKFAAIAARNIVDYNKRVVETGVDKMPYYVVIVDELADLMMLAPDETERLLARLAQMARATGIHLIISTQRPSVDIITGLIKAHFPARIAFAVASSGVSRVILDQPGAEKLLGRGDMLFQSPDAAAPLRMQGVFVSDEEIMAITRYWKGLLPDDHTAAAAPVDVTPARRDIKFNRLPNAGDAGGRAPGTKPPAPVDGDAQRASRPAQRQLWDEPTSTVSSDANGRDELYGEAVDLVQRLNKASISLLQRRLRIGYTRAARLIDIMEEEGIVGPPQDGSKPREVLKPKIESGDD
ncbi:MAG: hypothetical protein K8S97_02055, partial [Anaerolineae bacterium]|nr:hypothetical protein [Anaerolineae bacterium]